jgi:hypothetical protein
MASTWAATFSARFVGQARAVGGDHLGHAHDLRGRLGGFGGVVRRPRGRGRRHRRPGRGDGVEGRRLDAGVVVFGNDEGQCGHVQITFASFFSLSTSVATSGTFTPALRLGGSLTLSVFRRGLTSTPRSAGLEDVERLLLGLHDVGQRHVARLVQAQVGGDDRRQREEMVSRPPSTSRVTRCLVGGHSTLEAKVACGRSASAASIWPVWLASSSMACLPRMTRRRLLLVDQRLEQLGHGQRLQLFGGFTRMPRSAPMAIAVRRVSWHLLHRRRRRR